MGLERKTVDYIVDQMSGAGSVSARAMFGAYGLYCDGKMIGVFGDDQLFLKPTAGGRALAPGAEERPPYAGARPCLVIDAAHWEDQDRMSALARATTAELPAAKTKAAKAGRGSP